MFQFSGYPSVYLCIQYTVIRYCLTGFPHSEICGSKLICSSPQLIAACHVLLRLLMPRHSPYALARLNFPLSFDSCSLLWIAWVSLNRIWFTLRSNFAITFLSCSYHLSVKLCFTLYFWKDLYFTNLVKYLSSLSVRFILKFTLFDFQWTYRFRIRSLLRSGGLKWTRTTDLALIRRAL